MFVLWAVLFLWAAFLLVGSFVLQVAEAVLVCKQAILFCAQFFSRKSVVFVVVVVLWSDPPQVKNARSDAQQFSLAVACGRKRYTKV